jgi:hypothetical protein
MTIAVFEVAQKTISDALLDFSAEMRAQFAIHGRPCFFHGSEKKRQIGKVQFGNAVGEIARRLIGERENAVLGHPQQVATLPNSALSRSPITFNARLQVVVAGPYPPMRI